MRLILASIGSLSVAAVVHLAPERQAGTVLDQTGVTGHDRVADGSVGFRLVVRSRLLQRIL